MLVRLTLIEFVPFPIFGPFLFILWMRDLSGSKDRFPASKIGKKKWQSNPKNKTFCIGCSLDALLVILLSISYIFVVWDVNGWTLSQEMRGDRIWIPWRIDYPWRVLSSLRSTCLAVDGDWWDSLTFSMAIPVGSLFQMRVASIDKRKVIKNCDF